MAELLRIDQVVNTAIDCELARAKRKFGACRLDVVTLARSRGDTMVDRQLLRALRFLNRTGSRFNRVSSG
jgi:hypothetical protein